MDTQCSPTVSLDTGIRIVNFAPFASSNGSTILSRHAWYTTIFIQSMSIYAPIRTIDEAISHLGGFSGHGSRAGRPNHGHGNWRPAEWRDETGFWTRLR